MNEKETRRQTKSKDVDREDKDTLGPKGGKFPPPPTLSPPLKLVTNRTLRNSPTRLLGRLVDYSVA